MRPVTVVMGGTLGEGAIEVATTEDDHSGKALRRIVPTKRSAKALARGARIGVRMIRMPSNRKTSSKLAVNLVSRSRIRNRTGCARPSP